MFFHISTYHKTNVYYDNYSDTDYYGDDENDDDDDDDDDKDDNGNER